MSINLKNYNVSTLVIIVGLCWSASSHALSFFWGYGFLQGVGPTTVVLALLFVCDKWLWRVPLLRWLLVKIPDLNGIYSGYVTHSYGGAAQHMGCTLEIQQTASHIRISATFEGADGIKTKSVSREALFSKDKLGNYELMFFYENTGSQRSDNSLEQHYGFNLLEVQNDHGKAKLSGMYFTNRNPQTRGEISVTREEMP